ncbi:hypothetical protein A3SI_01696 [Nitritalea halalkaliphila LW7]|uniref:Copper-binding protein MbnP-like domain-containing protein n=1 Tax=Nitritalea halalkaliphila LW7 TaxID=1189621 RepID=I5CA91_9BACT|nr:MbnP family protein [Nitritalea halalkaliphila]EIM78743.1 hypothetical protein A3SI_01696 [Nitritalea halalkaliphila LW7]
MKVLQTISILILGFIALFLSSCQESESPLVDETGEMIVKFDNYVGNRPLVLEPEGSTNYRYALANGQSFNITRFGYYISHIQLEGPNGEIFSDPMLASASEVKGYYRVNQEEPDSWEIHLKNIPAGQYNKITFNLGVKEDGIVEGAVGGILDRAAGGWFWNWNSGFIHYMFEGHSPASERVQGDLQNRVRLHLGGWKNVAPVDDLPQRFFDNNVKITLPFDATVRVNSTMRPSPHIHVDALEVLGDVDFSIVNNIHTPAEARPFASRLQGAFVVDHTHQ